MAMKPKVALVKDGFLPPGSENKRGRLSLDAINHLKDLAASGWDIEGYSVSKATDVSEKPVVSKVSVDPHRVFDVPNETRPEELWRAFVADAEIGMREVCNICKSSLTYCPCTFPRVWVDYDTEGMVYFKPRTTPLQTKRF